MCLYKTVIYKNTFANTANYKKEVNVNYPYNRTKQIKVTVHKICFFSLKVEYKILMSAFKVDLHLVRTLVSILKRQQFGILTL